MTSDEKLMDQDELARDMLLAKARLMGFEVETVARFDGTSMQPIVIIAPFGTKWSNNDRCLRLGGAASLISGYYTDLLKVFDAGLEESPNHVFRGRRHQLP
jgi:hypothetical protein